MTLKIKTEVEIELFWIADFRYLIEFSFQSRLGAPKQKPIFEKEQN